MDKWTPVRLLWHTVRKTLTLSIFVLVLLVTNALTLLHSGFHEALSRLFSGLLPEAALAYSPSTKNKQLAKQNDSLKKANQKLTKAQSKRTAQQALLRKRISKVAARVSRRTAKNALMSVSSTAAESVPYLGIGFVVAVTAKDVVDACDTMKDMDSLLSDLGLVPEDPTETSKVCGYQVPTKEEMLAEIGLSSEQRSEYQRRLGGTMETVRKNLTSKWGDFTRDLGTGWYQLIH